MAAMTVIDSSPASTDALAHLRTTLARRVAIRSESQNPERSAELLRYLDEEIEPQLARMGFVRTRWANPVAGKPPFLFAERIEDPAARTVLMYGHGDVVLGYDAQWQQAASPWTLEERDARWYGRGTADNKGQHTINLAALEAVLARRGKLGCNVKWLFEIGEEIGSPGLRDGVRGARARARRRCADRQRRPAAARRAGRRCSSGRAAAATSRSTARCATARTTRATGADCSPTPA